MKSTTVRGNNRYPPLSASWKRSFLVWLASSSSSSSSSSSAVRRKRQRGDAIVVGPSSSSSSSSPFAHARAEDALPTAASHFDANRPLGRRSSFSSTSTTSAHVTALSSRRRRAQSPSAVSGFGFFDRNGNGDRDVGDGGIGFTHVWLFTCTDELVKFTETDASGFYRFDDLFPSRYYVMIPTPPRDYAFSDAWNGEMEDAIGTHLNPAVDNSVNPTNGRTACFDLGEGEDRTTSFGMTGPPPATTAPPIGDPSPEEPSDSPSTSTFPSSPVPTEVSVPLPPLSPTTSSGPTTTVSGASTTPFPTVQFDAALPTYGPSYSRPPTMATGGPSASPSTLPSSWPPTTPPPVAELLSPTSASSSPTPHTPVEATQRPPPTESPSTRPATSSASPSYGPTTMMPSYRPTATPTDTRTASPATATPTARLLPTVAPQGVTPTTTTQLPSKSPPQDDSDPPVAIDESLSWKELASPPSPTTSNPSASGSFPPSGTTPSTSLLSSSSPSTSPSSQSPSGPPVRAGDLVGPVTTTEVVMIIRGIDRLEDEEEWSEATANYVATYFTNDDTGAFDVTATIRVTNQTSGGGAADDGGALFPHVRVTYDQTSTYKTSDVETYDGEYVATEPFSAGRGSEWYVKVLRVLSPHYEGLWSAEPQSIADGPGDDVPATTTTMNKGVRMPSDSVHGNGGGVGGDKKGSDAPYVVFLAACAGIVLLASSVLLARKRRRRWGGKTSSLRPNESSLLVERRRPDGNRSGSMFDSPPMGFHSDFDEDEEGGSLSEEEDGDFQRDNSLLERRLFSIDDNPPEGGGEGLAAKDDRSVETDYHDSWGYSGNNLTKNEYESSDDSVSESDCSDGSSSLEGFRPGVNLSHEISLDSNSLEGADEERGETGANNGGGGEQMEDEGLVGPSHFSIVHVIAPAGALGIVVDVPHHGKPARVREVKEGSPLADRIRPEDRMIAVDDGDVRGMTAVELGRLLGSKSLQAERKITVAREVEPERRGRGRPPRRGSSSVSWVSSGGWSSGGGSSSGRSSSDRSISVPSGSGRSGSRSISVPSGSGRSGSRSSRSRGKVDGAAATEANASVVLSPFSVGDTVGAQLDETAMSVDSSSSSVLGGAVPDETSFSMSDVDLDNLSVASTSEIEFLMYEDLLRQNRLSEICDNLLAPPPPTTQDEATKKDDLPSPSSSDENLSERNRLSEVADALLAKAHDLSLVFEEEEREEDDDDNFRNEPQPGKSSHDGDPPSNGGAGGDAVTVRGDEVRQGDEAVDDEDVLSRMEASNILRPPSETSEGASVTKIAVPRKRKNLDRSDKGAPAIVAAAALVATDASAKDTLDIDGGGGALEMTTGRRIDVVAPAGRLGVVLESSPEGTVGGSAYVSDIKEGSPVLGELRPGDRVVAVDGEDVSRMSAVNISVLLGSRSRKERKLTVLREEELNEVDKSVHSLLHVLGH